MEMQIAHISQGNLGKEPSLRVGHLVPQLTIKLQ